MKKLTRQRLKNIALFYLEHYDASSEKVRLILKRRLIKNSIEYPFPTEVNIWIEEIIQEIKHLGYLDDKRYAENLVRRLSNTGKSPSFIHNKLKLAGIPEEEIKIALANTDELENACLMIQKKHLGNDFKKDLAKLARAGFSYETACKALNVFSDSIKN